MYCNNEYESRHTNRALNTNIMNKDDRYNAANHSRLQNDVFVLHIMC